jgi:hypothetical protein
MNATIPQNEELIKNLVDLLEAHRPAFGQERVFNRVVALVIAEVMVFTRHTVTQLLQVLGLNEADWSAWYRLFSAGRFSEAAVAEVLLRETLAHVGPDKVYVVAGDGTQVPRTSRTMEGTGWLRCPRTPVFKGGIHRAQRWFNGSWLMPAEQGYSRAMPLRFLPAFPEKAIRHEHGACKEWQAAQRFLVWLRAGLNRLGRAGQRVLMVADGSYDTLPLWQGLPDRVTLLARGAKNRRLYWLLSRQQAQDGRRKYGDPAPHPQAFLHQRKGWRTTTLTIRGRQRKLRYRVEGPLVRYGAPDVPLFLLVVGGQVYTTRAGQRRHRKPVYYLVNAVQVDGHWQLPLDIDTLLFWAWQRWEVEVAHRELKTSFGLGDKQCWNPQAAVRSVQWSAWVYALLLLAGYRAWGLCHGPPVPTRWWRGAGRWSLATLWRAYRAAFWGSHQFQPLYTSSPGNWPVKEALLVGLRNAIYAAARP